MQSTLLAEINPAFPEEVACAASVLATPSSQSHPSILVSDEEPDQLPANGHDFHFVFLIDRSGSMTEQIQKKDGSYTSYISMAREALKLFVQSLPIGCKFSIISFGNKYEVHLDEQGNSVWNYSNKAMVHA